jgi:hypothetical protein
MRPREPESALAAVLGGAVTREQLVAAAAQEGESRSPLVRALLAQALPDLDEVARSWAGDGHGLRLEPSLVVPSPLTTRLLDLRLLRRERCLPVAIFEDVCVLAVEEGNARPAAAAVRAALRRAVLPVAAPAGVLASALDALGPPPRAIPHGPARRRDSPVHHRFRAIVLDGAVLDALPGGKP